MDEDEWVTVADLDEERLQAVDFDTGARISTRDHLSGHGRVLSL